MELPTRLLYAVSYFHIVTGQQFVVFSELREAEDFSTILVEFPTMYLNITIGAIICSDLLPLDSPLIQRYL